MCVCVCVSARMYLHELVNILKKFRLLRYFVIWLLCHDPIVTFIYSRCRYNNNKTRIRFVFQTWVLILHYLTLFLSLFPYVPTLSSSVCTKPVLQTTVYSNLMRLPPHTLPVLRVSICTAPKPAVISVISWNATWSYNLFCVFIIVVQITYFLWPLWFYRALEVYYRFPHGL